MKPPLPQLNYNPYALTRRHLTPINIIHHLLHQLTNPYEIKPVLLSQTTIRPVHNLTLEIIDTAAQVNKCFRNEKSDLDFDDSRLVKSGSGPNRGAKMVKLHRKILSPKLYHQNFTS